MKCFCINTRSGKNITSLGIAVALGALLSLSTAFATPIIYGDFMGTTVTYQNVREDSGTDVPPLYGAPFVSSDSLNFNPVSSFNSFSTGAAVSDITDGTLAFAIQAKAGESVPIVQVTEAGDYTLTGLANNAFAGVQTTYFINIVEVDGVGINVLQVQASMAFTPSNGDYLLSVDGMGTEVPWSGTLTIDIEQALNDANIPFSLGATRVTVVGDNTLTTLSQDGTSAFIAKNNKGGVVITVPEPASFVLLLLGVGACSVLRRTRR